MATRENGTERLVYEVLSGELQERYIELGSTQMHPNYAPNPTVYPIESVYGTAKETMRAIQAAFLIRWAGFDYQDPSAIDETVDVPQLFDTYGNGLQYDALEVPKTLGILSSFGMVEAEGKMVALTGKVKKVIKQSPIQVPTIMPRKGRLGVKSSMREGIRVHNLYNELMYGKGAQIPLGKTTSTTSVDRRRRNFKVIKSD